MGELERIVNPSPFGLVSSNLTIITKINSKMLTPEIIKTLVLKEEIRKPVSSDEMFHDFDKSWKDANLGKHHTVSYSVINDVSHRLENFKFTIPF